MCKGVRKRHEEMRSGVRRFGVWPTFFNRFCRDFDETWHPATIEGDEFKFLVIRAARLILFHPWTMDADGKKAPGV